MRVFNNIGVRSTTGMCNSSLFSLHSFWVHMIGKITSSLQWEFCKPDLFLQRMSSAASIESLVNITPAKNHQLLREARYHGHHQKMRYHFSVCSGEWYLNSCISEELCPPFWKSADTHAFWVKTLMLSYSRRHSMGMYCHVLWYWFDSFKSFCCIY